VRHILFFITKTVKLTRIDKFFHVFITMDLVFKNYTTKVPLLEIPHYLPLYTCNQLCLILINFKMEFNRTIGAYIHCLHGLLMVSLSFLCVLYQLIYQFSMEGSGGVRISHTADLNYYGVVYISFDNVP